MGWLVWSLWGEYETAEIYDIVFLPLYPGRETRNVGKIRLIGSHLGEQWYFLMAFVQLQRNVYCRLSMEIKLGRVDYSLPFQWRQYHVAVPSGNTYVNPST